MHVFSNMGRSLRSIVINWIVIFIVLLPFFYLHFRSQSFFLTHDGPFHIERTYHYLKAFTDGHYWPSWGRFYNNGFGSPLFLFLPPVSYLLPTSLVFAGMDFIAALKLSFLALQVLAMATMYFWLKKGLQFSMFSSLLGSIVYIYSPYILSVIFVRGALRELAGIVLAPLVLLLTYQLSSRITLRHIGWLASMIGLYLLTDGYSAILFSPLFFTYLLYLLFFKPNPKGLILSVIIAVVLGSAISAFITLPTILEIGYLKGVNNDVYKDHFVYVWQLFDPHWGMGFSMPGTNDSISFQIGVINLTAIAVSIYWFIARKIKPDRLFIFFSTLLVLLLVFITHNSFSLYIWEKFIYIKKLQFPWRLLAPVVLICAYFAAFAADKYKLGQKGLIILSLFTIILSAKYLRTNQAVEYDYRYLSTNKSDATAFHEFIPRWRDTTSQFEDITGKVEIAQGMADIQDIVEKTNSLTFSVIAQTPVNLRINTLFYPGWAVYIDEESSGFIITDNKNKKSAESKKDVSGLIGVGIPEGIHDVKLQFTDTAVRRMGKFISILGAFMSIMFVMFQSKILDLKTKYS